MENLKKIPEFKNEAEEFEFWSKSDCFEYINWDKARNTKFTNLKKTTKKISLTIPFDLFEKIKVRANKFNIPYQSLIKMYILKAYNEYLQK